VREKLIEPIAIFAQFPQLSFALPAAQPQLATTTESADSLIRYRHLAILPCDRGGCECTLLVGLVSWQRVTIDLSIRFYDSMSLSVFVKFFWASKSIAAKTPRPKKGRNEYDHGD
jgi:hypothetical protein